jgi:hypothetical protein
MLWNAAKRQSGWQNIQGKGQSKERKPYLNMTF